MFTGLGVAVMQLVLASQSQGRAALMRAAGYRFAQRPSNVPEPAPRNSRQWRQHLIRLARKKALAVAARFPRAFVVAADTALRLEGRVIGKPRNLRHATDMLASLAGRTHLICTALCVVAPCPPKGASRRLLTGVESARVTLRPWDRHRLGGHARHTRPLAWAGAYALQDQGSAAIVERIRGDPGTVIGLPLAMLDDFLRRLGYRSGGPRRTGPKKKAALRMTKRGSVTSSAARPRA
jgi:septum formation protein